MSEIRTKYSKAYSANFDGIFRKPKTEKVQKEEICTHRQVTGKFCMKHQGGCGLHYNHEPDGRCECVDCEPKKPSGVRYAGVCQCEFHEHCAKCDPEYFGAPPPQ